MFLCNHPVFVRNSLVYYRPQTKFAKVMFLQVSVCPRGGRGCGVVALGGCAWLLGGACVVAPGEGMRGCSGGLCMVLFGGHVWFYLGGHAWFYLGTCMVLFGGCAWFYSGGMRGFIWGVCVVLFGGACMVLFGGACMVLFGGMHGFIQGHAWFYSRGACVVFSVFSDTMRYGQ